MLPIILAALLQSATPVTTSTSAPSAIEVTTTAKWQDSTWHILSVKVCTPYLCVYYPPGAVRNTSIGNVLMAHEFDNNPWIIMDSDGNNVFVQLLCPNGLVGWSHLYFPLIDKMAVPKEDGGYIRVNHAKTPKSALGKALKRCL